MLGLVHHGDTIPDLLKLLSKFTLLTLLYRESQMYFKTGVFVIGNHADEMTPWLPVMSTLYDASGYISIPCCSWAFDAKYDRSNTPLYPLLDVSFANTLKSEMRRPEGLPYYRIRNEVSMAYVQVDSYTVYIHMSKQTLPQHNSCRVFSPQRSCASTASRRWFKFSFSPTHLHPLVFGTATWHPTRTASLASQALRSSGGLTSQQRKTS